MVDDGEAKVEKQVMYVNLPRQVYGRDATVVFGFIHPAIIVVAVEEATAERCIFGRSVSVMS